MRRLPGTNNFLIACDSHLALHDIENDRTYMIDNLHSTKIADFAINRDVIVSKGVDKGPFVIVKIDDKLAHVYQPNPDLMASKSVVGLERSPEPQKREISPFQATRSPSPSTPKKESGFLQANNQMDINFSAVSQSKLESPKSEISSGLQRSTVLYKQGEYEKIAVHKYSLPSGEPLEKITINKKFTKIFCGAKKVYMLATSPPAVTLSPEVFTSKLECKELYGSLKIDAGKQIFGLKCTPSSHLILQEANSNDLVVIDQRGNELTRYKAQSKFEFSRRVLTSFESLQESSFH